MKKEDKVMCINSHGWQDAQLCLDTTENSDPTYGDVLTILDVKTFNGETFLYFKEITKLSLNGGRECYNSNCFKIIKPTLLTNEITKELANKPLVKEGLEKMIVNPIHN